MLLRRHLPLLIALSLLIAALPPTALAQSDQFCFAETGYCISGRIREFWSQNDGLRAFGLPVTPQREESIEGRPFQVQWFERNRLELHPENGRPNDVLIGRLGADALAQSERVWQSFAKSTPQGDCRFFAETGHNVCGALLRSWRAQGIELDGRAGKSEAENLALFGLPLSGPRTETLSDGRAYTVQWFERARFEIHTEFSPPNDVLLGLLGNEILAAQQRSVPANSAVRFTPADGSQQLLFESNRNADTRLFPGVDVFRTAYIFTMNPNGSEQTVLTRNHIQRDQGPVYSPDGSKIAFYSARAGGLPEIYLINADGSGLSRLTLNEAADGFPAWSPDGRRIAFASERDGNWEIYVMNADGSGQANLSRSPGSTDWSPTWAPDGGRIAYRSANFGQEGEIIAMGADGSGQINLTNSPTDESEPTWSPNGQLIAFESNRSGNRAIFIMDGNGANPRNLSNNAANDLAPAWSPDGSRLAFESDRDGNREIYVMLNDGGGQTNVSTNAADDRNPSWGNRGARPADPCADVPDPINAVLRPGKCVSINQDIEIDIYGFLAGSQFEYRATPPGGTRTNALASGRVTENGERSNIRFPARSLSPGRWILEFTFFQGDRSFYGSTIYLRIDP